MPTGGILYPWEHQQIKDDATARQQAMYVNNLNARIADMNLDDTARRVGVDKAKLEEWSRLQWLSDHPESQDNPLAAPTQNAPSSSNPLATSPITAAGAPPVGMPGAPPAPSGNPLASPRPQMPTMSPEFIGQQQAAVEYRQKIQAQQTAQAEQYYTIVQEPIEHAKQSGDMKTLRKILEMSVSENPGNQVIAQKSKAMLTMMDNGVVFGPGQTATMPLNIPGRDTPEFQKVVEKLSPFLPEGITPTPGTQWKLNVDGKRIVSASEVSDGSAKEPASTEANYRQGLEEKLRQEHPDWSKKKIQFEAANQVRKENEKAAKEKFVFQVDYRAEKKDESEAKKNAAKKSPDEDMLPAAMEYFVTHKLPGNMRDPATQKQFRRVFNNTLKRYGISPEAWAQMGPNSQAAQKALNKITTVNAQVSRDEETAKTLLRNVVKQGKAIQPSMSGFKKLDDWINHLQSHYRGNPKAVNVENTIYEALVDYGKVMGGNVGAGGLTDSARREAQNLLTAGMAGGKNIQEIVDNMISNMEVRTSSNKTAENALNNVITGALNRGGTSSPAPRKIGRFSVEVE